MMRKLFILLCITWAVSAQITHLIADGNSAGTYGLLNRILGGTANSPSYEVPDCVHPIPHITQQTDAGISFSLFNTIEFRSTSYIDAMDSKRQQITKSK